MEQPDSWVTIENYLHDDSLFRRVLAGADELCVAGGTATSALDPVLQSLAERLAQSKQIVQRLEREVSVAVIFGMWREVERLQPCASSNPLGENCLVRKLESLDWLFDSSGIDWHVFAVDDDCPRGSGNTAREIADGTRWSDKVSVLHLKENFPYANAPLNRLRSLDQSVKGGAIALGALAAIEAGHDLVLMTDCDNSVNLGQAGLLLERAVSTGVKAIYGNRLADKSTFFWHPNRSTENPSYRLTRHMRLMLIEQEMPLADIWTPFRIFDATYLRSAIERMTTFNFAFDEDLAFSLNEDNVKPLDVPYVFVDSFAGSTWNTQGDEQVQFQRLTGVLNAVRGHGLPHSRELADAIDNKIRSSADVRTLMNAGCPPQLLHAQENEYGTEALMSPIEIASWLHQVIRD